MSQWMAFFFFSVTAVKSFWIKWSVKQSQEQNQWYLLNMAGPCFLRSWMTSDCNFPQGELLFLPCFAVLVYAIKRLNRPKVEHDCQGAPACWLRAQRSTKNKQPGRRNIHLAPSEHEGLITAKWKRLCCCCCGHTSVRYASWAAQ